MSKKEKTNTYTQCKLTRTLISSRPPHTPIWQDTTTWLPTKFAIKGKVLTFEESKESSILGRDWLVAAVYETKSAAYIEEHERDYLIHRKATDI